MAAVVTNPSGRVPTWWSKTKPRDRLVACLGICLALALLLFAWIYSTASEYRLLFRNLEPEDAGQVVEWLKQEQIPYRLESEGRTIMVSDRRLHEARLKLAAKGLPKNKVVGMELFDQTSLGATEFVQQLNYTRALQGELSRTIGYLEGIERATVHIARPRPTIFQRKPQPVTASVVLHVRRGYLLDYPKVYGIAYLIASAVEGLSLDDVTILDQQGNLLFQKQAIGLETTINPILDQQKGVEEYLRGKAQTMLDQMLGKDRALVRVNVELEGRQQREVHETYNPENQTIQSETVKTRKTREQTPDNSNSTGSRAKIKKEGTTDNSSKSREKDDQEETRDTRYALDKIVKEVESKSGSLKRITLALALDQPLASQMEPIGRLIQQAVGFEPKRGDTYEVTTLAFLRTETKEESVTPPTRFNYETISLILRSSLIALAILMAGLICLRLLKKMPTDGPKIKAVAKSDAGVAVETTVGAIVGSPVAVENVMLQAIQQVRQVTKEHRQTSATLLHNWFNQETKE